MLDALGLNDFFDCVIIGDECARSKPFPDPYLTALNFLEKQNVNEAKRKGNKDNSLSINKDNVIIVEDSRAGISAGVAADIRVVGIKTTLSEEELLDAGCFMTIDDFDNDDLWRLITGKDK